MLGEVLGGGVGDTVRIELREGPNRDGSLVVTGLTSEMFGLQGHMRMSDLGALLDEEPRVTQALLLVDERYTDELMDELAEVPQVANIGSRDATYQI